MKHRSLVFALLFSIVCLGNMFGQEHPGSLVLLSSNENVRKELKLTSLQEAILKSIRQEYKADAHKIVSDPLMTKEQRHAALAQLSALNNRYNRRILSTLDSTQKQTLRAIEHRVLKGYMLTDPSVQNALGLNKQQKDKIELLRKRLLLYVVKINTKFESGKIDQFDRLRLLKSYRQKNAKKMERLLTPSQLVQFKKMEKAD